MDDMNVDPGSSDATPSGATRMAIGSGQFFTPDSKGPHVLAHSSSNFQVSGHIDYLPGGTSLSVFLSLQQGGDQYDGLLWFSGGGGGYSFTFNAPVPAATWFLRFEARSNATKINIPNVTGTFSASG